MSDDRFTVRVLIADPDLGIAPGETVDVDAAAAAELVGRGIAEIVAGVDG